MGKSIGISCVCLVMTRQKDRPVLDQNGSRCSRSQLFFSFEEHLFHESINIRGIGEKPDDVIIQSEEGEGYFVFCDSENIFFENLTLEGRRNFEGALVVNGGKCNLINVNISCDMVTRGIIVRPFAVCKGNG